MTFTLTSCVKDEFNIMINKNMDESYLKFESNTDFLDYLNTFQTNNDTNNVRLSKAKRSAFKVNIPENFKSINQICLNVVDAKLKKNQPQQPF